MRARDNRCPVIPPAEADDDLFGIWGITRLVEVGADEASSSWLAVDKYSVRDEGRDCRRSTSWCSQQDYQS